MIHTSITEFSVLWIVVSRKEWRMFGAGSVRTVEKSRSTDAAATCSLSFSWGRGENNEILLACVLVILRALRAQCPKCPHKTLMKNEVLDAKTRHTDTKQQPLALLVDNRKSTTWQQQQYTSTHQRNTTQHHSWRTKTRWVLVLSLLLVLGNLPPRLEMWWGAKNRLFLKESRNLMTLSNGWSWQSPTNHSIHLRSWKYHATNQPKKPTKTNGRSWWNFSIWLGTINLQCW